MEFVTNCVKSFALVKTKQLRDPRKSRLLNYIKSLLFAVFENFKRVSN